MEAMPGRVEWEGVSYDFERFAGQGAEGVVAIYERGDRRLALKRQNNETEATPATGACAVRLPLAIRRQGDSVFSLLPYAEESLEDWLRRTTARDVIDVYRIVLQLVEVARCLTEVDVAHYDLKPSNLLFLEGRLVVGDLGGLAVSGSTTVVTTPELLPSGAQEPLAAAAALLGEVILRLLLTEDAFRRVLARARGEDFGADALRQELPLGLFPGLSASHPAVLDLAALGICLMGARDLAISLAELRELRFRNIEDFNDSRSAP
jgi:hypothetical protein